MSQDTLQAREAHTINLHSNGAVQSIADTEVGQLAEFVQRADYRQMSDDALGQLKIRILDTLGVAIGALDAEPIRAIRELVTDLGGAYSGGRLQATLIGGGTAPADRAAFFNSGLSRYLDFMDSYLAKGETNHPSDNFGAVLASAEVKSATGAELLSALAVAYQVHTRLSGLHYAHHLGPPAPGGEGGQGRPEGQAGAGYTDRLWR